MASVEPQTRTRVRVYTGAGRVPKYDDQVFVDFDATKIDISPDGSMILTRITASGESRLNPITGKLEEGVEVRILAVIGPDGRVRAETVDVAE